MVEFVIANGDRPGGQLPRTRADVRLNTAELNVFTLALFLLCAVRLPNPLRLLILDDPLQNMDELTVATVVPSRSRPRIEVRMEQTGRVAEQRR
jgi:hypothetical protein